MKKPFRLLIAVPSTGIMAADFVKSLIQLTEHLQHEGIAHHVEITAGTLVYLARNSLACKAINENFTHLLFLDSDMIFHDTIVEDLLFCGKDFVCGAFQSRRPPYGSCIFKSLRPVERVKEYGMEPFRVDGCGFAAVLTKVDLLEAVRSCFGTCFRPTEMYGEDLAFCDRVKQLGREIWCEPTVRPGHIAHVPLFAGEHLFGGEKA